MSSVERPVVLMLCISMQSFFDEQYASFIKDLTEAAQLKRAKTATGAVRYLEANKPKAVLVTDEGLSEPENAAVLEKVVAYVNGGGLVLFGLHMPNFIAMDKFDT